MTSDDVIRALRRRHGCLPEQAGAMPSSWVCIEEAFKGSWGALAPSGGIDLLAAGATRSARVNGLEGVSRVPWPVIAYEVKVSRADFRREVNGDAPPKQGPPPPPPPRMTWDEERLLTPEEHAARHEMDEARERWHRQQRRSRLPEWPAKAKHALDRCHYFIFATPKGLLRPEEIARRERPEDGRGLWLPAEAGLVEVDRVGVHDVVRAPLRDPAPWSRGDAHWLIRQAGRFGDGHSPAQKSLGRIKDAAREMNQAIWRSDATDEDRERERARFVTAVMYQVGW